MLNFVRNSIEEAVSSGNIDEAVDKGYTWKEQNLLRIV